MRLIMISFIGTERDSIYTVASLIVNHQPVYLLVVVVIVSAACANANCLSQSRIKCVNGRTKGDTHNSGRLSWPHTNNPPANRG